MLQELAAMLQQAREERAELTRAIDILGIESASLRATVHKAAATLERYRRALEAIADDTAASDVSRATAKVALRTVS